MRTIFYTTICHLFLVLTSSTLYAVRGENPEDNIPLSGPIRGNNSGGYVQVVEPISKDEERKLELSSEIAYLKNNINQLLSDGNKFCHVTFKTILKKHAKVARVFPFAAGCSVKSESAFSRGSREECLWPDFCTCDPRKSFAFKCATSCCGQDAGNEDLMFTTCIFYPLCCPIQYMCGWFCRWGYPKEGCCTVVDGEIYVDEMIEQLKGLQTIYNDNYWLPYLPRANDTQAE